MVSLGRGDNKTRFSALYTLFFVLVYKGITENKSEREEGEQCRYSAILVSLDSVRVAEN